MIKVRASPNIHIQGPPPPPPCYGYSGPANPACFLTLDSLNDWAGQSFTTIKKNNLEHVELWFKKSPGADFQNVYIELYAVDGNGHPIGPILASQVIPNADILEDYSWVSCVMSGSLPPGTESYLLSADTKYCIVIYSNWVEAANILFWACGGDGSDYPNGDQEWSVNRGETWVTDTTRDQLFRCYPTPTTLQDYYNTGQQSSYWCYGNIWLAQTFTANENYKITSVRLEIRRDLLPGNVIISIQGVVAGRPDGNNMAVKVFNANDLPPDMGWVKIVFDTGAFLSSGIQYAIVMKVPGGDASNRIVWSYDNSGEYPGGSRVDSYDGGLNWNPVVAHDMMFETWGI